MEKKKAKRGRRKSVSFDNPKMPELHVDRIERPKTTTISIPPTRGLPAISFEGKLVGTADWTFETFGRRKRKEPTATARLELFGFKCGTRPPRAGGRYLAVIKNHEHTELYLGSLASLLDQLRNYDTAAEAVLKLLKVKLNLNSQADYRALAVLASVRY